MDGFDGTVARLTNTESDFGMQLDSLVDSISFGLVPAFFIYSWGFTNPSMTKLIGPNFGKLGLVVTEAEKGQIISFPDLGKGLSI